MDEYEETPFVTAPTLVEAMALAWTKFQQETSGEVPEEGVWELTNSHQEGLTEDEAVQQAVFWVTRNGKPVLQVDNHGEEGLVIFPVYAQWQGDPAMDPEKLYEDMEQL